MFGGFVNKCTRARGWEQSGVRTLTSMYYKQCYLRVFGRMNYKVKCFCLKVAFLNGCKDSYK